MVVGPRGRLHGHRRRRRLRERYRDQSLNYVRGLRDVDMEAAQQQGPERKLNENDRGEREGALPRPNRSSCLCVSGHQPPALALQRV